MQLSQALKYVNRLEDRTFLGKIFHVETNKITKMKESVFLNGSRILYNPSTATSGPRTNLLWFDEEGKISESNKIENNRNAYGMVTSSKGKRRIRHTTTLSVGTPAQEVYERLVRQNTVYINVPTDCTWWTEEDWRLLFQYQATMPRWWVNCEFYSILDAPGGRILTHQHPLSTFEPPTPSPLQMLPGTPVYVTNPADTPRVIVLDNHWRATAGTDWNASWGHTVSVMLTNDEDWLMVDEFRGTSLERMADFLKRWQEHPHWGNKWTYCAERQGGGRTMQSRKNTLGALGVTVHREEPFNVADQIHKTSLLEHLNENGQLHFSTYCAMTIRQAQFYRRDEATGLPAKHQEDHMIDGILHALETKPHPIAVTEGFAKWR
jgi:hypothetical protein